MQPPPLIFIIVISLVAMKIIARNEKVHSVGQTSDNYSELTLVFV